MSSDSKKFFGLTVAASIFVAAVVFIQLAVRVWFLQDHLFFHAEQVRDFFVVWNAWHNHTWITLGPIQADTNGVHLGPGYYYLLLFFAAPLGFSPLAGPVMTTVLFLAAWVLVFWYLATRYNETLAVMFGLLLAVSENYFLYSSYALNMNVVFLFEALLIIGLMEYVRVRSHGWLIAAGIGFTCLLHLHLSAYVLAPVVVFWFVYHYKILRADKAVWKPLLVIVAFFLLSYAPFIVAEFQHQFPEIRALFRFVFVQGELSNPVYNSAARLADRGTAAYPVIWAQTVMVWIYASAFSHEYDQVMRAIPYAKQSAGIIGSVVIIASLVGVVVRRAFVWQWMKVCEAKTYGAFSFIALFSVLLISFAAKVHSTSVRHYIMIFFVPLLVLAIISVRLWNAQRVWQRAIVVVGLVGFVLLNAWNASIDFQVQAHFPINEPYEGFSSNYTEQRNIAQKIADAMQSEIAEHPTWVYEIRASKNRKGLRDVMSYLLLLTDKKQLPIERRCEKRCTKEQANRVIIIDYGHPLIPGKELLLTDGQYAVYLMDQGAVKKFEKQLQ